MYELFYFENFIGNFNLLTILLILLMDFDYQ